MKVKDCMCNEVIYVRPECSTEECAKLMGENHIGCIPVCDNTNKVVGIVTDRDILLRTIGCRKEVNNTKISDIMTCNVTSCTPETDVKEAERLMKENQIRRIPVMENNKVIGILTLGDLATKRGLDGEEVYTTLEDICKCTGKNAE